MASPRTTDSFHLLEAIAEKERELDGLRRRLAAHRGRLLLPEGRLDVLRCRLGETAIAFRQDDVEEVVGMAELTVLPGAPPWFAGLLRIGAERLPIVDLAARESGIRRELDPSEFLVIVRASRGRFGLVVDALEGLSTIEAANLDQPSPDLPYAAHVLGVATIANESTLLLSVEPLAPSELAEEAAR